jgi:hypothetical protein
MPTLRRILKYTPAVVLGLLVVAWVVSLFRYFHYAGGRWLIGAASSTMFGCASSSPYPNTGWTSWRQPFRLESVRGGLRVDSLSPTISEVNVYIPIPLVATMLLPLAIGPCLSFRFRLWHYLAYTALVGVELACYLRWQE